MTAASLTVIYGFGISWGFSQPRPLSYIAARIPLLVDSFKEGLPEAFSSRAIMAAGRKHDHGILFLCLHPLAFVNIMLAGVGCSGVRCSTPTG
jgi:hypothetical protein